MDNDCQIEKEAMDLFNSDKSIFAFMVTSGGCIGRSKRFNTKQNGDNV